MKLYWMMGENGEIVQVSSFGSVRRKKEEGYRSMHWCQGLKTLGQTNDLGSTGMYMLANDGNIRAIKDTETAWRYREKHW